MQFKLIILAITIIVTSMSEVRSQSLESKTFKLLCEKIGDLNDNWAWQKKLKDVVILEDPAAGERLIQYDVESAAITTFNKLPHDRQQAILYASEMPSFPLSDTVLILDPNLIFDTGSFFAKDGHYFENIGRNVPNQSAACLEIKSFVLRSEHLILSLAYPNSQVLTNIYFLIRDGEFEIYRVSNFDPLTYEPCDG